MREYIVQDQRAGLPASVTDTFEFLPTGIRKTTRQRFLGRGKDVDREIFGVRNHVVHRSGLVDADDDQRRLKRDGGERAHGHTVICTGLIDCCHNGDTTSKASHDGAECIWFETHTPKSNSRAKYPTLRTWLAGTKSPATPTRRSAISLRRDSARAAWLISPGTAIVPEIKRSTIHLPLNSARRARSYAANARCPVPGSSAASTAYGASNSPPRRAEYTPSPVNGSKKSAASPTSAAPCAHARRVEDANGPVARTGSILSAVPNRSARCGWPASHSSSKALGSLAAARAARAVTTSATLVSPPPTSAIPTYPSRSTCISPTSLTPGTFRKCATNAMRRGMRDTLVSPSRRPITDRSPSAPITSGANISRRSPSPVRSETPHTAPEGVRSTSVTRARSTSCAPADFARSTRIASRIDRRTAMPRSLKAR